MPQSLVLSIETKEIGIVMASSDTYLIRGRYSFGIRVRCISLIGYGV